MWKSRPGSLHTLLMNRYYWKLHVVLSRENSSTQEWESNCQHSRRNTGHIFKGVERMGGFKMVKHKINGIGRSCWQNFLRGMKLESDTHWDTALGNLQQSEAIHRSPHCNKSMVWDELRVWTACQRVTAGAGVQKSRYSAANESQTRAQNTREMNPAGCTALQENQHLHTVRESKNQPQCATFTQNTSPSWDSTSCWPGHRGNYKPLAKLFPSLCTGPCWAGIKKRGSPAQPGVLPLGWGKTKQIYQGTSWFWMQGLFWSFLSDFALLKHEASSWPGVWRQVFPSVPGKEAGSFIGSRHSFHSCLCQLWIRLFFWRTSLINWKLVNPLHGSGFSLEQCSNTRAVLHLELWHFSRWLQPCT